MAVTARGVLEATSARNRRAAHDAGTQRLGAGSLARKPSWQVGESESRRGRQTKHANGGRERTREGSYERPRPRDEREKRVEGLVRGREEVTRAFLDV